MNWGFALACGLAVWPGFRGQNGAGVDAGSKGLPAEIAPDKNVIWKAALPGGSSSPVLTRDRLYITAWESGKLLTIAMDRATGRVLWRRELEPVRNEARHNLNNPASATPVTDGTNVYSFFSDFGLVAYGPDGNELWRVPLGPFSNLHGMGASPILAGNRLILLCDQDVGAYLLAVDKRTGKQLWKVDRPSVVHGFATPTLLDERQIIVPGSYLLMSYSVETGQELWSVRGLTWQIKNTAVAGPDGTIYVTGWAPGADAGESKPLPPFETVAAEIDANKNAVLEAAELNPSPYKHGGSWRAIDLDDSGAIDKREWGFYRGRRAARNVTLAVKPGDARGDLTDTHVLWRNEKFVPQVSSPLLYQGVLYTIKDGGILASLDPKTGAVHKSGRIPGAIDAYYSSPVAADGKLYIASEKGKVSVIKAGPEWEALQVTDFDEGIYATPAIDQGRIYLRTASTLYCFGVK
jgi:outer membrane protein assembly factor BamB